MQDRLYKSGELIGHFQVLELLACGGFSAVYLVQDVNEGFSDAHCALKLSRYDFRTVSQEQRHELNARARREFELLQELEHQSIVSVYEHGFHEGVAYYVMELVDGVPLAGYLTEQPRTYGELAFIIQRLASALSHAHRQGVVHRDLKPGNVLVERQLRRVEDSEDGTQPTDEERAESVNLLGEEMEALLERVEEKLEERHPLAEGEESEDGDEEARRERARRQVVEAVAEIRDQAERRPDHLPEVGRVPVLIDFGLGHELGVDAVTAPGVLMGTLEFLPPNYAAELLSGRRVRHQAEPHEDIFQAGILLYSMLTGRLPTKTPAEQPLALLAEIRDEEPAHVLEVNPEAPPALAKLAMLCLEKRSQRRPADGAALLWRVNAAIREDLPHLARVAPRYQGHEMPATETELMLAEVNAEPADARDDFGAPEGAPVEHLGLRLEPTPEPEKPRQEAPRDREAAPAAMANREEPKAQPRRDRELGLRLLQLQNLASRRMLRKALGATALALLGCLALGLRWHLAAERAEQRAAQADERAQKLTDALTDLAHARWLEASARVATMDDGAKTAISPPVLGAMVGGLPMPAKPFSWQLKAQAGAKNGDVCIYQGKELRGVLAVRGGCWFYSINLDRVTEHPTGAKCGKKSYDPPPSAELPRPAKGEPNMADMCFHPVDARQLPDLPSQSESPDPPEP